MDKALIALCGLEDIGRKQMPELPHLASRIPLPPESLLQHAPDGEAIHARGIESHTEQRGLKTMAAYIITRGKARRVLIEKLVARVAGENGGSAMLRGELRLGAHVLKV